MSKEIQVTKTVQEKPRYKVREEVTVVLERKELSGTITEYLGRYETLKPSYQSDDPRGPATINPDHVMLEHFYKIRMEDGRTMTAPQWTIFPRLFRPQK